jgi:hypothetical protein
VLHRARLSQNPAQSPQDRAIGVISTQSA